MPELTPFGDTFFDASVRAIVSASFLKSPSGGCVASDVAVTSADQRRVDPALCDLNFVDFELADRDFVAFAIRGLDVSYAPAFAFACRPHFVL